MKPLEFVVVLLCVLLGLGRGADLAFATDAATGLCTAGAVWWRYLVLGAVVLAAVLAGRSRPLPPAGVEVAVNLADLFQQLAKKMIKQVGK